MKYIYPPVDLKRWLETNGDDTFAVNWPINSDSVVLEVGGYQGRWAKQIAEKYNPHLYVFEPQDWAWEQCVSALKAYPNAQVLNYGLGLQTGRFPMGEYHTDGCSFVNVDSRERGSGYMREIVEVLDELKIQSIDLCLVNIEGYEFTLLPYMLDKGILERTRFFMCQFHIFADPDLSKYSTICEALERTHRVFFDFGTTLTAWERRT